MRALTRRLRADDDRGLSLVETIVALTVLTIVAVPTTAVVLSSMQRISEARVESTALEVARSQIEQIRAMPYVDIGIVGGAVPGLVPAAETVTVDGVDMVITTSIAYADDPVPGGFRSYADYKQVTVEVTATSRTGVQPTVLSTNVAASGTSGKQQFGNLEVTVSEEGLAPDSPPVSDLKLHLLDAPVLGPVLSWGPTRPTTQIYSGLTPNPDVAADDWRHSYELRLTADVNARTDGTYWMRPSDFADASSVRVLEYNTVHREIRVYRPGELVVELRDAADPSPAIPDANLLDDPALELVLRTSGNDPDAAEPPEEVVVPVIDGRAVVTHFDGYAIDPGADYALAPGTWWLELRHATADLVTDQALGDATARTPADGGPDRVELEVGVDAGATTAVTMWASWADRDPSPVPADARVTEGLVGLWAFDDTGPDGFAYDASGAGAPWHLVIGDDDDLTRHPGHLSITGDASIVSLRPGAEEAVTIDDAGEVTVEAWVRPSSAAQGGPSSPIASWSAGSVSSTGTAGRNLALAQGSGRWSGLVRHSGSAADATPATSHIPAAIDVAAPVHVAVTVDAGGVRQLHLGGELVATDAVGTLDGWDPGHLLRVGTEVGGGPGWRGDIHLLAIYDRALTPAELAANVAAGPDPSPSGLGPHDPPPADPSSSDPALPGP